MVCNTASTESTCDKNNKHESKPTTTLISYKNDIRYLQVTLFQRYYLYIQNLSYMYKHLNRKSTVQY